MIEQYISLTVCLCCDWEAVNYENDASRFCLYFNHTELLFFTLTCFRYKNKIKYLHSDSTAKLKTKQEKKKKKS